MDQSSSKSLPDLFYQCEENLYNEIEILGEPVFDVYDDEHLFYVNDEEVSVTSYGDLHQQIGNEQPCPFYQREEDLFNEKDIYREMIFDIDEDKPIYALDDGNLLIKRDGFSGGVPAFNVEAYEDLSASIHHKDGMTFIGSQRYLNYNIYRDWEKQVVNCILWEMEDLQIKAEPPDRYPLGTSIDKDLRYYAYGEENMRLVDVVQNVRSLVFRHQWGLAKTSFNGSFKWVLLFSHKRAQILAIQSLLSLETPLLPLFDLYGMGWLGNGFIQD
ncbi:hypothetical protein Bca52824_006787 [Brassica carinata]|uniref:Uncharacterized protein n=1 Tax=Brassica carinata TaxID=52824 RepID=A0A8X7W544_BRACI|nr:hypothetical protein Bca52824_006787 [Brassica carinata]